MGSNTRQGWLELPPGMPKIIIPGIGHRSTGTAFGEGVPAEVAIYPRICHWLVSNHKIIRIFKRM